jgi:S-adenosylmethionine:tRNA ribosyltransferase-isomerase
MKLEDYNYHLPESLIAQEPCPKRDQSRMIIVRRKSVTITHGIFASLLEQLEKGDTLVINDSRVIPARLMGQKETGGKVEILLLSRKTTFTPHLQTWEALLKPAKSIRPGMNVHLAEGCEARIGERITEKKWLVTFAAPIPFDDFIDLWGKAPLPPYIKRNKVQTEYPADRERYQTIYSVVPGSIAAPTAGLHFSEEVMAALNNRGISVARITLHVGYGTFRPVEVESIEDHRMDEEYYEISEEAVEIINHAGRVIAVGTTSARTLEAAADEHGKIKPGTAFTELFIYPGYRFKRVDALLTNFHLPKSTLYLLVCAFACHDLIRKAYNEAIAESYRFYSYGDCMLIL